MRYWKQSGGQNFVPAAWWARLTILLEPLDLQTVLPLVVDLQTVLPWWRVCAGHSKISQKGPAPSPVTVPFASRRHPPR